MQRWIRGLLSAAPFLVVGGLLYAAFFIKPTVSASQVQSSAWQRGEYMFSVVSPAPNLLLGVGSEGKTWLSSDLGKSWIASRAPVPTNLQGVAAWSKDRLVAVGDGGAILVSQDGAKTWEQIKAPVSAKDSKLMRVRASGASTAWAVGEMGMALRSNDFGRTWAQMTAEEDKAWNDVAVADSRVVLVGEFGRIAVSEDAGVTWQRVPNSINSSLMAVAFRDAVHGVAVGLEGVVLSTEDGGKHWQPAAKVTTEHLFDVAWDGRQWLVVGDAGVLLRADETVSKWAASRVTPEARQWHTSIAALGHGFIAVGASANVADNQ